ncbi:MAG: Spy/CpxP family protein refolding chaperone [Ignavibacteriae bacterium]|nr:Spy/CpxP family protein refolding chaperone [Ignavibacteria bacterium]MBI3363401.1 Spy/CpxP family protein refolding chaperone [Ignavibacteriota bacterium]
MSNDTSRARNIFYFLILTFELIALCANAQVPPDRDGLLGGEGMGYGQFAEINGYPGPKQVLDLADKLKLTAAQKKSMQEIYGEMRTRAKELGKRIVGIEEELNEAFSSGLVNEKATRDDCEQIGKLRGRLRAAHLAAHLKAKNILTETQIESYKKLRSTEKNAQQSHQH